jgi:hypothetical protein
MATTQYGLTLQGFVPKPQSVIISEVRTALQQAYGTQINLLPRSVFANLIGVQSEREALLWSEMEAIYASQYPAGAEGTSVDNILALNNLRRLGPLPTKTAPTDTTGVHGLLLFGTAGTVIPINSIVYPSSQPSLQFTLDAAYTIAAAVNAVQQISFFGGIPTVGTFTLAIVSPFGTVLTTTTLNWNDSAATIQAAIRALHDVPAGNFPYTDVVVSGSISSGLLLVTFGGASPTGGNPPSGAQTQNLITVPSSTLQDGSIVVNVNVATGTAGAPAQAVASATCIVNGPNFVAAGFLNSIGSPTSGWASVTNPLDCITGRNEEGDTAALTRRADNLTAEANGPVQAIADKVGLLPSVIQARGFENTGLAADQKIAFSLQPTGGYFKILFTGIGGIPVTTGQIPYNALSTTQVLSFSAVPSAGSFSLRIGVQAVTVQYNDTATAIQQNIRTNMTGYETIVVTGNYTQGFFLAFGLLSQLPVTTINSLTGATIVVTISIQSRINEISQYALARVIGSYQSGLTISFNGSAGGLPQILVTIPDNSLTPSTTITVGYGRPGKSFEILVNDNNGEASNISIADSIFGSKPAGIEPYGNTLVPVTDQYGTVFPIKFSRPTQVPIYIVVNLETDLTTAVNPQFNVGLIPTIQQDLVTIGSQFPIGGEIIGRGSNGLVGAFNSVPGIVNYTLSFGTSPNPITDTNIQLQQDQIGEFQTFHVVVSYF